MSELMTLPEIYVLRHGETEWNREGRMQGCRDSALTDLGRAQAWDMAETLSQRIPTGGFQLWASPMGRAIETATAIAATLHLPIRTDPRLREIQMGEWAGLTMTEIAERWPAPTPHETMLEFYARTPGGESFDSLWNRSGSFLRELTRPAIIVTHGFTSRFLRTQAVGLGMDQLDVLEGGQGVIFHIQDGRQTRLGAVT